MPFDALREQAFAPALPAAFQRCTTAFGFHASPKTVLTLARPFGWLIGAFHKTEN
jgi:hypothetical protein